MTICGKNEFFLDLFVEGKSFVKSHYLFTLVIFFQGRYNF